MTAEHLRRLLTPYSKVGARHGQSSGRWECSGNRQCPWNRLGSGFRSGSLWAEVLVSDLGSAKDGEGADKSAAELLVEEIKKDCRTAVANGVDITSFEGIGRMIRTYVDNSGNTDIPINSAGILHESYDL